MKNLQQEPQPTCREYHANQGKKAKSLPQLRYLRHSVDGPNRVTDGGMKTSAEDHNPLVVVLPRASIAAVHLHESAAGHLRQFETLPLAN